VEDDGLLPHPGVAQVPADFVANEGMLVIFTIVLGVVFAVSVGLAVVNFVRTRSPLFLLLIPSTALLVFFEPLGDVVGNIYVAQEAPLRLFTLMGRPMPLLDLFLYVGLAPGFYYLYRLMLNGASLRTHMLIGAGVGIGELACELWAVQTNMVLYHHNHTLIFGLPLSTIVQNISLMYVGAGGLILLMPYIRGWRWSLVILYAPSMTAGFVFATTFPNYLVLASDVSAPIAWAVTVLCCFMNILFAYVALHLPSVVEARKRATHSAGLSPAVQVASSADLRANYR
jgi:hypothetical protein